MSTTALSCRLPKTLAMGIVSVAVIAASVGIANTSFATSNPQTVAQLSVVVTPTFYVPGSETVVFSSINNDDWNTADTVNKQYGIGVTQSATAGTTIQIVGEPENNQWQSTKGPYLANGATSTVIPYSVTYHSCSGGPALSLTSTTQQSVTTTLDQQYATPLCYEDSLGTLTFTRSILAAMPTQAGSYTGNFDITVSEPSAQP